MFEGINAIPALNESLAKIGFEWKIGEWFSHYVDNYEMVSRNDVPRILFGKDNQIYGSIEYQVVFDKYLSGLISYKYQYTVYAHIKGGSRAVMYPKLKIGSFVVLKGAMEGLEEYIETRYQNMHDVHVELNNIFSKD